MKGVSRRFSVCAVKRTGLIRRPGRSRPIWLDGRGEIWSGCGTYLIFMITNSGALKRSRKNPIVALAALASQNPY